MIVFVHGVPETAAIWAGVQRLVGRPSTALELPGFGNPRPAGFGATKDDYLGWLLDELRRIDEPVDLVGHDWGAILTARVAHAHADQVRSYVFDCGNVSHPDYEWHAFAQIWQAPGEGEAFFESQAASSVEDRAAGLTVLGVPMEGAREMAAAADDGMASCILDLYRSAIPNPHADWGPIPASTATGLVVHPSEDPFSDEPKARAVASALGAGFATLEAAGHFWPYQAPEEAVALLEGFWASLPAEP